MNNERREPEDLASEDEELRFWDEHDPTEFDEGPADIIVHLKRRPKKAVTFRLDEELYDELKSVAAEHGIPYQRLMRELLRHSLTTLRKRGKRRSPAAPADPY